MDDNDICYECQGYRDDYYMDENGDLVCACYDCPVAKRLEEYE